MCMSKPSVPAASAALAPPLQAASMPGATPAQRRKPLGGLAGGTLLTSPSGVATAAMTSGTNTLLGA